ncbi:GTPase-associated system all-helical protein GASH [Vibrio lentus]|nr:GTPase-associated system all-helical protein GASH [Vibrio lentus]PMH59971.1 hypothetical protein BCU64_20875 [Vibrio lentus]
MTDVAVLDNEVNLPHPDFSDWMSSITIGLDRDNFQLRWDTIHRLFINVDDDLEETWVSSLVQLALGNLEKNPDLAERLCNELKQDDVMFSNSSGQKNEELQVIASYALKLLLDRTVWDKDFVAQNLVQIQSASLNSKKAFKGGVDLLSLVAAEQFKSSRELRKKKSIKRAHSFYKKSQSFESEFKTLEDTGPNASYNKNALLELKEEVFSQLEYTNNSLGTSADTINLEICKLSEEQEVLWLATIGWSDYYEVSFSELEYEQRILSSAIELAERTLILAELPSVKGVAARLGVEAKEIPFSDWVSKIAENDADYLINYLSNSNELTPVLFAVHLANSGNWKNKWKETIGIDYNFEICGRDLVLQLYRELLTIKWSKC